MPSILDKYQLQDLVSKTCFPLTLDMAVMGDDQKIIIQKAAIEYGFTINEKEFGRMFKSITPSKTEKAKYNGAILEIEGDFSIPSIQTVEGEGNSININLYIYHQTIADNINRKLCRVLLSKKAISTIPGGDEEWLYEIISDVTDEFFYEKVKIIDNNLPIFDVKFKAGGTFTITEMDRI